MKVAILTLLMGDNYGGILQCYALQKVLEKIGCQVVVISRDRFLPRGLFRQSLSFLKSIVSKYIFGKDVILLTDKEKKRNIQIWEHNTRHFIESHFKRIEVKGLEKLDLKDLDAIIVGSDQVWRPKYFKRQWKTTISDAYLRFAKNRKLKRISYAASFGTNEWEYTSQETIECQKLINQFDAVSVREDSAIKLCQEKFHIENVAHVVDPTMLLDKKEYIKLVETANVPYSSGNLMYYILDYSEEKEKLVNIVATDKKLMPFSTNLQKDMKKIMNGNWIQPPLESWLRGFMDADFVITDSFHACVFSIIFNRPFIVIANEKRGSSRFESLLNMFGLIDNLLYKPSDYDSQFDYSINKNVNEILENRRKESFDYLFENLNK